MTFLFSRAPTSSDSLITSGSDDPEAQLDIPEPEPLGTSTNLSPSTQNKWWWKKKLPGASLVLGASHPGGSKSPPKNGKIKQYSASPVMGASSAFPSDGKSGFLIVGLLVILAVTTLITVQFKDSELVLALFTAVALSVLGVVYYVHCCSTSPSFSRCCRNMPWSRWDLKNGKLEDFHPISLPPTANVLDGASDISSKSASSSVLSTSSVLDAEKSNGTGSTLGPQTGNTTVCKASPHRRDWSLPTMPTGTLLNHRRVSNGSSSSTASNSPVLPQQPPAYDPSVYPLPQQQSYQLFSKLKIEFSLDDPVTSRVQHVSNALKQLAAETESVWIFEARLADAVTTALTSCMSRKTLSEVKQALDRELRQANMDERYSSLYATVFSFLQKGERDAVLTHLSAVHHHHQQDESIEEQVPMRRMVISDIDDTLVPTFKDRRGFSWGVPYPGVRQLYKELIGTTSEAGEDEATMLAERVAFVTARPGLLRTWTRQETTKAGFGGSLILMGYATTATTPQGMLSQKVKQVRELRSLWPECSITLVGDNGQRDIDLGAMLLKDNLVEAVFIHDIFASDEEIIRTTSTSFSGEDNSPMMNNEPNMQANDIERKIGFLDDSDLLADHHRNERPHSDEEEEMDELSHLALNDDRRAAAVQPKSMVRLISAPAALGSAGDRHLRPKAPSQEMLISSKTSEIATWSSEKKRAVMVLEPSVPVGFRHEECSKAGIDLFQTYAGAALRCYQKGLIPVEALERVTRTCASDLGMTMTEGVVKQRLVDGFLRDVARVALEFRAKTPGEKVEFLEFVHEAIRNKRM